MLCRCRQRGRRGSRQGPRWSLHVFGELQPAPLPPQARRRPSRALRARAAAAQPHAARAARGARPARPARAGTSGRAGGPGAAREPRERGRTAALQPVTWESRWDPSPARTPAGAAGQGRVVAMAAAHLARFLGPEIGVAAERSQIFLDSLDSPETNIINTNVYIYMFPLRACELYFDVIARLSAPQPIGSAPNPPRRPPLPANLCC